MKKSSKSAPEVHERDVSTAQREKGPEAEQLAELRARIDQQLAPRNAPLAHQALNAFMDEPVIVSGDPTMIIDGMPAARHGDKCACGATLIASQIVSTTLDD